MRRLLPLILVLLWSPAVADHHFAPPHSSIQRHKNAGGTSCCGVYDIAEIAPRQALGAHIGSKITALFPDGVREEVTVNIIYPTPDGTPYITRYGCLFRGGGG